MKIKSLEFEAFGPYLNRQYLDFSSLNEAELFLVTGDTGAGKTTIFDAVSFALYGVSSGDVRQVSQFRNQKADSDVETYVKLTFEIRNHTYIVTRYPNYLREGYKTETRHRAYLEGAGEHIIEGVSEVASKIKEIVGVDADEFRQVAMIAQGQFTRLIQASSREREAILRELFSTHAYASFQEQLKRVEKERKDIYTQQKTKLDTYLEDIEDKKAPLEYLNRLQQEIEASQEKLSLQKKEQTIQNEKVSALLQTSLQQDQWTSDLQQFQTQKENLDLQSVQMQSLKQKLHQLLNVSKIIPDDKQYQKALVSQNDLFLRLNEALDRKKELNEKMVELKTKEDLYIQLEAKFNQNQKDLEKINEDLHKVEQFEKAKSLVRQAKNLVDAINLEVKNSLDKKKILENALNQSQAAYSELPNVEAMELALTHQTSMLQVMKVQMNQIETQKQKLNDLLAQIKEKKARWEKEGQKLKEINSEHINLEMRYQASLAGILASELKDDMPCPVCGSTHHPKLALIHEDDITKERLDEHQKVMEAQNQILQTSFGELMQTKQALELERERYQEQLEGKTLDQINQEYQNAYDDFETKKKAYQENTALKKKLEEEIQTYTSEFEKWQVKDIDTQSRYEKAKETLQKRVESYEFIRGSFHDDYETLDVLVKKKSFIEREMRQQKTSLENYKEVLAQIQNASMQNDGKLSILKVEKERVEQECFNSKEALMTSLNTYQITMNEFNALKQEVIYIESYQQTLQDYEKECALVNGQIHDLKNKLNQERLDSTSLKKQKATIEDTLQQIEVMIEKNKWQHQEIQKKVQEIASSLKSFEKAEQKYQEVYDLSRLVSGQNPQRITFESYILAAYFEAILERANLRFVEMTNGRYALLRKIEGSGRAMQGLDINVMDYESGKPRDIRTLSGGESFKAALSLALGMADLISENAGGIELDTLFIDEGFGSLDERSLDIALDTLIELKQEHKVVGIISHVSQLKERLSAKIIVTHQKNTSIAKIS